MEEQSTKTIEAKVADALLQRVEHVEVGGKTYDVAPPSIATLALASEAVALLPHVKLNGNKVVEETLANAKDLTGIARIIAILILGARHVDDRIFITRILVKRHLWGLVTMKHKVQVEETRLNELTRALLEEMTPRELHILSAKLIQQMQTGDFFGLTTFLTEINLTRPTKVGTEATASGQ